MSSIDFSFPPQSLADANRNTSSSNKFEDIFKNVPLSIKNKVQKNLKSISVEEGEIIDDLKDLIDSSKRDQWDKCLKKILKGAYVVIVDGGYMYNQWEANCENKQTRVSSHESNSIQYGIRGKVFKEVLFSKKVMELPNGTLKEVTWLQMERYPTKLGYFILHLWTWVLYKITGKNQGPYGSSSHTEKSDPLVIVAPCAFKENSILQISQKV
jgi:hypothetical protein